MKIFCPFCLIEHSIERSEKGYEQEGREIPPQSYICKQEGRDVKVKQISQSYINKVSRGVPVYPIVVIGYTGCGKTTFLCSLVYKLFESDFFHVEPLDQETINRIRKDYFPIIIDHKKFLPLTSAVRIFEEPLLLELNIPQMKWFGISRGKEIILLIYDVSGETYNTINNVVTKFPHIAQIPNLMILVDLYTMYTNHQDKLEFELQSLISTVKRALEELGNRLIEKNAISLKKKNAIICFTKTDDCWGKDGFGPLSKRDDLSTNLKEYQKNMIKKSSEIEEFLQGGKLYDDFYRSIVKDFGGWFFIDVSSVGGKVDHEKNTFNVFSPYRVTDPILWLISIK